MVDNAVIGPSNILGEEWSNAVHKLIDCDPKAPPVSFSTITTFVCWDEDFFGSIEGDQCLPASAIFQARCSRKCHRVLDMTLSVPAERRSAVPVVGGLRTRSR